MIEIDAAFIQAQFVFVAVMLVAMMLAYSCKKDFWLIVISQVIAASFMLLIFDGLVAFFA